MSGIIAMVGLLCLGSGVQGVEGETAVAVEEEGEVEGAITARVNLMVRLRVTGVGVAVRAD